MSMHACIRLFECFVLELVNILVLLWGDLFLPCVPFSLNITNVSFLKFDNELSVLYLK